MRSTLATLILGMSLVAGCEVGDAGGGGGGGGDDTGGGGTDAAIEQTPKLTATVDKTTISTELGTTSQITVSLTSSGGFSGAVALTAEVVDGAGAAVPGWTVGFNNANVNLAANGSGSAVATLTIPTQNQGLAGTVKIHATSTLGVQDFTTTVTALNQVTMTVTENGGQCVYPTESALMVKIGTKVRFLNKFSTAKITIHSNGGNEGVAHEPDPGHDANTSYDKTFTAAGTFDWYCHQPGPDLNKNGINKNPKFTVVP